MWRTPVSGSKKLEIVKEARSSGNDYGTARRHIKLPNQIQAWRNMEQRLIEKTSKSKSSLSALRS